MRPTGKALTPAMSAVARYADQAKLQPEGIELFFLVTKYGSLPGAASAARSFQTTFSSLRARKRRQAQREEFESKHIEDAFTQGKYDSLSCQKTTLGEGRGYSVLLIPIDQYGMAIEAYDLATGERIKAFTYEFKRCSGIAKFWGEKCLESRQLRRAFTNPLTLEEEEFWFTHEPEWANDYYTAMDMKRRTGAQLAELTPSDEPKPFDLADLSVEEMFGGDGD